MPAHTPEIANTIIAMVFVLTPIRPAVRVSKALARIATPKSVFSRKYHRISRITRADAKQRISMNPTFAGPSCRVVIGHLYFTWRMLPPKNAVMMFVRKVSTPIAAIIRVSREDPLLRMGL